jgi:hypothetical protein
MEEEIKPIGPDGILSLNKVGAALIHKPIREKIGDDHRIPFITIPDERSRIVILFPHDMTYPDLKRELQATSALCDTRMIGLEALNRVYQRVKERKENIKHESKILSKK